MARNSITGLRVRDTFLEWTTLGSGKKGIEVLAARQVQLEGDAATLADPGQRAEAILRQCPDLTGIITIGLAATPPAMNKMINTHRMLDIRIVSSSYNGITLLLMRPLCHA